MMVRKEEKEEGPFGDRTKAERGLHRRGMGLWGILTSVFPLHVLNEHYHESTRSLALCSRHRVIVETESRRWVKSI